MPEPMSSARGITRGQQGTVSFTDEAQASSATCWAAWMGERGRSLALEGLSTDREVCVAGPGCTRSWAALEPPLSSGWEAGCTGRAAASGAGGKGDSGAKDRGSVVVRESGLQNP